MDGALAALGWALLHALWSGTVVSALAALALALLRDATSQVRYAVCAIALSACVALPVMHWLWLMQPAGQWPVEPTQLPAGLQGLLPHLPLLAHAWAGGVGLMGLRIAMGLAWVALLRRRAVAAPPDWQRRLDRLAARLGLRRPVRLALLPGCAQQPLDGPITVGHWRPLVLLPAALLTRLPPAMLEALIAHELAHVRRWDYLANLMQSLAEALLFFHPGVWWLSSRLRRERELVADAIAVQALDGDGRRLAVALDALARLDPPSHALALRSPLPLAARGGALLSRIQTLMLRPPSRATAWRIALPALVLAGAVLLVQTGDPAAKPVATAGQAKAGSSLSSTTSPSTAAASPDPESAVVTDAVAADAATLVAHSPRRQSGVVTPAPSPSPYPSLAAPAFSATALIKLPVNARHMMVVDDLGQVLMAKDADAIVPIASLTKLMTAMVVLDARLDAHESLRIEEADVDRFKHSASRLPVGARLTRGAALELALLASDNRAAAALARSYPGGPTAFDAAVQAKIRALGLSRTTLHDPTGLSPGNQSSAADVARLAMAAARYPEINRITSDRAATIAVDGRAREWRNTNRLVGGKGWDIRLSKTGFTNEAGRCLAMRMRSGDRTLTVVLLDADGSAQRQRDAAAIRSSLARRAA